MSRGARRRLTVCAAGGLLGSAAAFAVEEPRGGVPVFGAATTGAAADADGGTNAAEALALVEAMAVALRTLTYEGTFVHVQDGFVSSMRIVHTFDGEGELERMISLDGEAREVIRDRSLVTCIWPGSDSVVVSKSKPRRPLPNVETILLGNASYTFALAGTDRVAGVMTDVVDVLPRDDFRYGYRFWLDRETRLLLRSMLLEGGRSVEQVLFTEIDYPDSIALERFEVDVDERQLSWVDDLSDLPEDARAIGEDVPSFVLSDGPDRVRFEGLPAGYEELSETYGTMPPDEAMISHVMVSDGMASVSVYVEYVAVADQDTGVEGLSSMGAVNAYGLSLDDGFVTVVGEVPSDTVQAIAEAVRLVD